MNGFILMCILFSAASGHSEISKGSISDASVSRFDAVRTTRGRLDIKKELDKTRAPKNNSGRKRPRRFTEASRNYDIGATVNKVGAGLTAAFKTYVAQPITHGNFLESTIRGYTMMDLADGKFVFGTLDGELNQSFRLLWRNRRPRTGDIISCRIPSTRMAEHYMMVLNDKIVEVGVIGGKSTHNGVIFIDSYRNSSYINSKECLYHENRMISRAEQINEKNGDDTQAERMYQEILFRLNCTLSGRNTGQFHYDLMSCNCQDLVLYWTYGYVETNCLKNVFNGCSEYMTHTLTEISRYVHEIGGLEKKEGAYSATSLDNVFLGKYLSNGYIYTPN